ncbi:MAG: 1-deoxy-D-xylulose-5-phosphate reductoisomerase, partial [Spirochaetota bacterium]|nr:1-deoxy-D-xylulose-5-phosphate reductoisomerase [Spirochaetota bacterium]
MKQLAILGSTGSIGKNTLEVVRSHPKLFNVYALTINTNIIELKKQVDLFEPRKVVICDEESYKEFRKFSFNCKIEVLYGDEGLLNVVSDPNVNLIVNALVGFSGLKPTIEGIINKKDIALANKETIVVGGELVLKLAKENNVKIIPIDSEHSALLFLLRHNKREEVRKLILTASGGPFCNLRKEEFAQITLNDALNHPTWKMGKKITIDSSTLMNKGFEVIEAHHLFGFDFDDIEVIIHKESIIHSMIETVDGEIYAQLGPADMKFPIQNALTYPEIIENDYHKLNLWEIGSLSFSKPDFDKFNLLNIAYQVGKEGGTLPTVLNASNEVAVNAFLNEEIAYIDIV